MKKVYFVLGMIFLLLLAAVFVFLFFSKKPGPTVSPLEPTPQINRSSGFVIPTAPAGEYNVLLLGQGGAGHSGGILTDSMMVVHLNTIKKTAALVFIPRDLWVNNAKINEAYSKNGLTSAKEAVSSVTGLSIQYGIVIDFPGFIRAIDSLGGIDINIQKTFDDYFYPITGKELETCGKTAEEVAKLSTTLSGFELEKQFTCRYEHLHFDAGVIHVDGTTALKFSSSRHSGQDGSDFARGARQQVILLGLKNKLLSLDVLHNIDKFFNNLSKMVKTDLDLATVKTIVSLIINPTDYKIAEIVPSDANVLTLGISSTGQSILLPKAGDGNWQDFQEFVKRGL